VSLDGIEPHWLWLIAAALLGIAELLMPGVFLIWLAAAAAVTGFAALLLGLPLAFQFALFALLAIAAVYSGRRWYSANPIESSDPLLNDRAARLIGQTVIVVGAIENGVGRVRVGDSVWNARGADAEIGARVRVVGAEGTCLRVERVPTLPTSSGGNSQP
jgi:membrane protein implicated in regulation of membrane protease activity